MFVCVLVVDYVVFYGFECVLCWLALSMGSELRSTWLAPALLCLGAEGGVDDVPEQFEPSVEALQSCQLSPTD